MLTDDLLKDLLWIVRFERMPALRAESCLALATLGVKNPAVEETLRELVAVDDDPLVLRYTNTPSHNWILVTLITVKHERH